VVRTHWQIFLLALSYFWCAVIFETYFFCLWTSWKTYPLVAGPYPWGSSRMVLSTTLWVFAHLTVLLAPYSLRVFTSETSLEMNIDSVASCCPCFLSSDHAYFSLIFSLALALQYFCYQNFQIHRYFVKNKSSTVGFWQFLKLTSRQVIYESWSLLFSDINRLYFIFETSEFHVKGSHSFLSGITVFFSTVELTNLTVYCSLVIYIFLTDNFWIHVKK
jgi:hypothetical protein